MSVFKRTVSGLNNQHLFHNVDIIVFVEGGKVSYTKGDVQSGRYTDETDDIVFWKNIFSRFVQDKKLKFKSVGSKTLVKELALDIASGSLQTVYVAMDNEFDEILRTRVEHENVFYTFGYSFENDVWSYSVIKLIVEQLTAITIESSDIENNFKSFLKDIKTSVYADGYLFKRKDSFFPRKGGTLTFIECAPVDLPFVKKDVISAKMSTKGLVKNSLYSFGSRFSIDTLKFCYGHLLADYCCQLIGHYIKKRCDLPMISKEIIYRMGLKNFFDTNFSSGSIYDYYHRQFIEKGHIAQV